MNIVHAQMHTASFFALHELYFRTQTFKYEFSFYFNSCHFTIIIWALFSCPINCWLGPSCFLFHAVCKPEMDNFSSDVGKCEAEEAMMGGWNDMQMQGKKKWGMCHWCVQPYLPLLVSIWSPTGPSAPDRCSGKTEGCWGVKEAINISYAHKLRCLLLPIQLSLSPQCSICRNLHPSFLHSLLQSSTLHHRKSHKFSLRLKLYMFNPLLLSEIFISLFLWTPWR